VSYQVAPGARVVAPCGGRAVFAGPFRSFGLLLIVDCGGGYHFVLSGFDRLDAQVGQSVKPGAPIGVMPGWDPRTSGSRPLLYVELRRNGQAVNPGSFLRAKSDRPG
jgi:septal ring factor EnvC (AmiA/AmiB activator)